MRVIIKRLVSLFCLATLIAMTGLANSTQTAGTAGTTTVGMAQTAGSYVAGAQNVVIFKTSSNTQYADIKGVPVIIVTSVIETENLSGSDPTWTADCWVTEYDIFHQPLWKLEVIESWNTNANVIQGYQNPPDVLASTNGGGWAASNAQGATSVLSPGWEIEASGTATFTLYYFGFIMEVDSAYVNIFCYGDGSYTYTTGVN